MSDIEFASCRAIACCAGFRAVQSTPTVSSSGALIGILSTHFPSLRGPSDATMAALKLSARAAADAIIVRRSAAENLKSVIERSSRVLQDSYRVLKLADHAARYCEIRA